MAINERIISRTFRRLYGKPCWGVQYDRQLNLSLNFGKPSLRIREPRGTKSKSPLVQQIFSQRQVRVRGQWWLWIFCAYWRLSLLNMPPVTGSSSGKHINEAIARLDGQKLTLVDVNSLTGATRFGFDLGGTLECRRFAQDSADLWTLYEPSGNVLAVQGNGTFSHGPGSATKQRFQKMKVDEQST